MRRVLILLFMISSAWSEQAFFDQKRSLIEWRGLDYNRWLNYELWKDHRLIKDQYPKWRQNLAETKLHELMGRVIGCVGECRVYRGEGYVKASYRSSVKEGDEVITEKNSYLWIFLLDGTIVRMSPGSSISFKEINVGKESNFLFARINSGNVLWLSRDTANLKEREERETDTLFLPLAFHKANPQEANVTEDDLYSYLQSEERENSDNYRRLNELIDRNNKYIQKKLTNHFLVMPNGTVVGKKIRMEFIVLSGKESYFKNRSIKFFTDDGTEDSEEVNYYYRGYANKKSYLVAKNKWYKIAHRGRKIEEYDGKEFGIGEYLTRRIPTIMVARELMMERYSKFIFAQDLTSKKLAINNGYRLWTSEEFDKRMRFLSEYTRREETTNLLVAKQLADRLEKIGEELHGMNYSTDIYRRAIHNYSIKRETSLKANSNKEILNSTKRSLWNAVK